MSLISNLIENKKTDHIHLMTEDWGGIELTNDKQNFNSELINHVKIFNWYSEEE